MRVYILIFGIVLITGCNKSQKMQEIKPSISEKIENTDSVIDTIDIPMLPEQQEIPDIQLLKKHDLTEEDLYTDYDGGTQLSEYFLIELIDKETFNKNKILAVNMVSKDTSIICKHDGILKLPCKKREINFVDNLTEDDNYKEYTYVGHITLLDAYLIQGTYWEDWNYFLVDKLEGKTIQTFLNMPHLSADGKYVVSIDFDTIEGVTFIDLYEITEDRYVEPLVGMYAKKWIPINPYEPIYWGNDNYLYVPVVHNSDYWASEGNYKGIDQYIRIKPIAS